MQLTANRLREAREKKSISLREVSTITKINIKVLERIEAADVEALPAGPFLRGFIQTYAKFLDLDVDEILQLYSEETTPVTKELFEEPPVKKSRSQLKIKMTLANLSKQAFMAAVILGLCFAVYGLVKLIQHYENEGSLPEETIQAETTVPEPMTPAESQLEATLQAAQEQREAEAAAQAEEQEVAEEEVKEQAPEPVQIVEEKIEEPAPEKAETEPKVEVAEAEEKKEQPSEPANENLKAQKPSVPSLIANVIPNLVDAIFKESLKVPASEKKKDQPKEETKEEVAENQEQPTENSQPIEPVSAKQELIVESIDKTSFSVSIDGKRRRKINLPADSIYVIKAQQGISVSFADAGSVSLAHNGKYIGVPGEFGQQKEMSFP